MHTSSEVADVASPQISLSGRFNLFATHRQGKFLGPRTLLTRASIASGTTGSVLPMAPPFPNATYQQTWFGPAVQCQNANDTVVSQIDAAVVKRRANLPNSTVEVSNDYFAFVPPFDNGTSMDMSVANIGDPSTAALHTSNQIWIRVSQPAPNQTVVDMPLTSPQKYLVCKLSNCSYTVNFTWHNGLQSQQVERLDLSNTITYPQNFTDSPKDRLSMAFSAVMWSLAEQLVGFMSLYRDTTPGNNTESDVGLDGTYAKISTNLQQTTLIGSSDLDSFFMKDHEQSTNVNASHPYSDERLQDMAFARNETLDVLITELSSNITLSLLSNPVFAYVQSQAPAQFSLPPRPIAPRWTQITNKF